MKEGETAEFILNSSDLGLSKETFTNLEEQSSLEVSLVKFVEVLRGEAKYEALINKAKGLKELGVNSFKAKDYEKAKLYFIKGLLELEKVMDKSYEKLVLEIKTPLVLNLSNTHLQLKEYKNTLERATEAICLSSFTAKAYYYRGVHI